MGVNDYYLVVEEWLYPTESGREVCDLTFDTLEDAVSKCACLAADEAINFYDNVKEDCLQPARCENGYIITTKMGLDPYYYYARVIPVTPAVDGVRNTEKTIGDTRGDNQAH